MSTWHGRPVHVSSYAGYRGEQEPRALEINGERLSVIGIDDRWVDPEARYFKVAASDGRIYLLRCDAENLSWSVLRVWQLDS